MDKLLLIALLSLATLFVIATLNNIFSNAIGFEYPFLNYYDKPYKNYYYKDQRYDDNNFMLTIIIYK
jgi:hypothetical protein